MKYFPAFFIAIFISLGSFAQNTKGDKPAWLPNSIPKGNPERIRTKSSGKKGARPVYPPARNYVKQPSGIRPTHQPLYENNYLVEKHYNKARRRYLKDHKVIVSTRQIKRVRSQQRRSRHTGQQDYRAGKGSYSFSRPFRGKMRLEARWGKYRSMHRATTTDLAGMSLRRKNFTSGPSKLIVSTSRMRQVRALQQRSIEGGNGQRLGRGSFSFSRPFRGKVRPEMSWGKYRQVHKAMTTDLAGMPLRRKNFSSPPSEHKPKRITPGSRAYGEVEGRTKPGTQIGFITGQGQVRPRTKSGKEITQSDQPVLGKKFLFGKPSPFGNPGVKAKPSTAISAFGNPKKQRAQGNINGMLALASGTRRTNVSGIPAGSRMSLLKRVNVSGIPVKREGLAKTVKISGMPVSGRVAYEKRSGNRTGFTEPNIGVRLASGVRGTKLTTGSLQTAVKNDGRKGTQGNYYDIPEQKIKYSTAGLVNKVERTSYGEKGKYSTAGLINKVERTSGGMKVKYSTAGLVNKVGRTSDGMKGKYSTAGLVRKVVKTSSAENKNKYKIAKQSISIDFVRYPHSDKEALKGRYTGDSYDNNGSRFGNFFNRLFSRRAPGQKSKPEKLRYDKNERKLWKDLYE